MFSQTDISAMLYLQTARAERRLFTGQLYTPAEVAEISLNRGNVLTPTWYLGGQMHESMFEKTRWDTTFRYSALAWKSPGGLDYAVLSQALGNWEHRFLLQLLGDEFERFIRETQEAPLHFTLADAAGHLATVLTGPQEMRVKLPDGEKVSAIPTQLPDLAAAAADCMRMAARLLSPEELPAPTGTPTAKDVCVSVVQSRAFHAQYQAKVEAAVGMRMQ
jgi:hypothetical protein